ncbi:MAG: DUF4394 domain-containing protein [Gemmatimonadaceae bacterium]
MGAFLCACAETPTGPESAAISVSESRSVVAGGSKSSEIIYGLLEGNGLIVFNAGKPNQTSSAVRITGLAAGESVVGIDFRPSDNGLNGVNDIGKLYAVTDASRIYIVDPETGVASSPVALVLSVGGAPVLLSGSSFGVGFNPAADRLRVHSNTGQNLRINVETGVTIVDGPLAYGAADANAGNNADVTATGYTNNDANAATGTELYAIDVAQDVLVELLAPNTGVLTTVGSLGVNSGLSAGFDISNTTGTAYAALSTSPSGKSTLYSIDLETGAATKLGMLAQTKSAVLGIAVKP